MGNIYGMLLVMIASAALLAGVTALRRRQRLTAEASRKLLHLAMGLVAVTYPWLFGHAWPVVVLSSVFILLVAAGLVCEPLQYQWREAVCGVGRGAAGEFYFPISTAVLFTLAGPNVALYCVPVLVMAVADAAAAVVGSAYGRHVYRCAAGRKTVEGSTAFFLCAFLATLVPLLLLGAAGPRESLGVALLVATGMTLVEALAWGGLDNLLVPLGSFALLRILLTAAEGH